MKTPLRDAPDERGAAPTPAIRGRGSAENPANRFDRLSYVSEPDPAPADPDGDPGPRPPRTVYLRDPTRTALATNQSPDVPFDTSLNPYRGCEHGCSYCVAPETRVLHEDLSWRPIGELKAGDRLVGFDESPRSPGVPRKLRLAVVLDLWWSRKPTYRIATPGAEVVATADHRWLTGRRGEWCRTDRLSRSHRLRRLLGSGVDDSSGVEDGGASWPAAQGELAVRERAPLSSVLGRAPAWVAESIEAVEPGRVRDVVDIQTTTGTFFAESLATHNCYARPTHEYLGFSSGLDFETRILVKEDAPELLRKELASRRFVPQVVAMSGVTDAYQPIERRLEITRRCLQVFAEFRNPVSIITKSALVARDVDVLSELAEHDAVSASLSITTLDPKLHRIMEPRASHPGERLRAIEALARAGIPVGVSVAPVIPGLTDHEIPAILAAARSAGARYAGHIVLRLPRNVKELFVAWLERHHPDRKEKILRRLRDLRGGELDDPRFGSRMRGAGIYADQIHDLFEIARRRAGFPEPPEGRPRLSTAAFRRPGDRQLALF